MKLRWIERFVKTAEAGSLTQAGRQLGIAQSVLSREIRLLEEELGHELLHRHGRGIKLTAAGRKYYESVKPILLSFADSIQTARDSGQTGSGSLRLGMGVTLMATIAASVARSFQQTFPDTRLSVELVDSLLSKLLDNQIAMAISTNAHRIPALRVARLFTAELYLVGLEDDLTAISSDDNHVGAEMLRGLPMILFGNSDGLLQALQQVTRIHGFELKVDLWISQISAIADLICDGGRFSIMPYSEAISGNVKRGLGLRQIVNPVPSITFEFAVPKWRASVTSVSPVLQIAQEEVNRAISQGRLRGQVHREQIVA